MDEEKEKLEKEPLKDKKQTSKKDKKNQKQNEKTEKKEKKKEEKKVEKHAKQNKKIEEKDTKKDSSEEKTSKNKKQEENKETEKKEEQHEETKPTTQEEKIDNKDFKQIKTETKKKKHKFPIIISVLLISFVIIFSIIFALININNDKILEGVTISGVNVANLTQDEATAKLEDIVNTRLAEEMTLKTQDYETTINATQINAKFDIENAVNKAYNIGREGNIVTNNYEILKLMFQEQEIELPLFYDEKVLVEKIADISSKIPGAVKQSSYYIEDDRLIIVQGEEGLKIKEENLKENIISKIKNVNKKYDIVTIETEKVLPDPIDLAKIREEIYKEPQNAYVSKNPTVVHRQVNGVDFNMTIEEAQKLLEEDKREYIIPLKITIPEQTVENLGEEAFPDELAAFSTRYDVTNYNRSNNLSIAAEKIDGTVVMPGETFSYNQVVGERTIAEGYKEAGAFAGGGVVQSVGGGICQVSSTLYNVALLANLEIIERSNHAFLTGYVPESRDATVSWGSLDFQFKNTRQYPIKIEASAKNGVCQVAMYGIKEKVEYEVVIQPVLLSEIPYSVKYIEDRTLEKGKEVVEQSGQNGCTSEAYRILKLNGEVVSKTLISKDTYDPMQRIVRKGTKEVKKPETQKPNTQKPEETTKPENTVGNDNNTNSIEE